MVSMKYFYGEGALFGGADIGMVPAGGTASTFLRGDGTWVTPGAGSGVTSITSSSLLNSTGDAITVNAAATGAVTLNVFEYSGGTNIGYVPRGSSNDATKYLDGTGNWTVPAGGGTSSNSFINNYKVFASKLIPNPVSLNTYCTFGDIANFSGNFKPTQVAQAVTTLDPNAGPGWTVSQQFAGYLIGNGAALGCNSADPSSVLCGIESTFQANLNGIHFFELWKGDICAASPPIPIKVGEALIDYAGWTAPGTAIPACKQWSITPTLLDKKLSGTEFFFITYKTAVAPVITGNVNFILNLTVQQGLL